MSNSGSMISTRIGNGMLSVPASVCKGAAQRPGLSCPTGHYCGSYALVSSLIGPDPLSVEYDFDPTSFVAQISIKVRNTTVVAKAIDPRNPRLAVYGDVTYGNLHVKDYLIISLGEARPNFITLNVSGLGVCLKDPGYKEECYTFPNTEMARFPIFTARPRLAKKK